MTLSQLGRLLSRGAVLARDANAIKRKRVPERVTNRVVGHVAGRLMRRLWR